MKNIKQILFYSILIFSYDAAALGEKVGFDSVNAAIAAMPETASKLESMARVIGLESSKNLVIAASKLGVDAAKIAAPAIVETSANVAIASANLGVEAAKIAAPAAVEVSKNGVVMTANAVKLVETAGPTVVHASSSLGVEAATQVAKSINGVTVAVGIGVTIYGVTQLYPIGKEIYENTFPNEKQKEIYETELIEARKKLRYLKAEEKFTDCIIKAKAGSPRGESGRPIECEEAAAMFAKLGGRYQVKEMTETFNEFHK